MSEHQLNGRDEVEVAHEALIRHWPRLRTWLETDRADLLLRESVREAAREWDEHGRDESYLAHRGRRLDATAALQQHPRLELNALERAYIDACLGLQHREERRRRLTWAAAVAASLAVAVVSLFLWLRARQAEDQALASQATAVAERDRANQQSQMSLTHLLLAQAITETERGQYERAALLARQASLIDEVNGGPLRERVDSTLRAVLRMPYFSSYFSVPFAPAPAGTGEARSAAVLARADDNPFVLEGHQEDVDSVAFAPDGQMLASASRDGTVRLWDLTKPGDAGAVLEGHRGTIWEVVFAPDGHTLASAGDDGTIRVWDLTKPTDAVAVLEGHDEPVYSIAFTPDGRTVASASRDRTIRLWDLSDPEGSPRVLEGHRGPVYSIAFAPDGRTLASASRDGTIRLWDPAHPEAAPLVLGTVQVRGFTTPEAPPEFPRRGETTPAVLPEVPILGFPGYLGAVHSVAFAPDGQHLASIRQDGTIRLWDLTKPGDAAAVPVGAEEGVGSDALAPGREELVGSVAFAPDGERLAVASTDRTIRLWDLGDLARAPLVLDGHQDTVLAVAFAPDGQRLASGSSDDSVRLWIAVETLADLVCVKVRRNLTLDEWRQFIGDPEQVPYQSICPNLPPGEGEATAMATPV